jgi:hypothetical protein
VLCSGQYTFNQAALEAGDVVVQASFTANNLLEANAVVPQLTAVAVQDPKLALVTPEPQCSLHFWGELWIAASTASKHSSVAQLFRQTSAAKPYVCMKCCCFLFSLLPLRAAEGLLKCQLTATSQGNMHLLNFTLAGDATTCTAQQGELTLPPGDAVTCMLEKNVTMDELVAAGHTVLHFPSAAVPAGKAALPRPLEQYSASLPALISASAACHTCRNCLAATGAFTASHAYNASFTGGALASAFGAYCTKTDVLKKSGRCTHVQDVVSNSAFANLGRRAAGLCFALELCDRRLGTSCDANVTLNGATMPVSARTADLCTGD